MKLPERFATLAQKHEDIAKAIRLTMTVMDENETAKARSAIGSKLGQAIKHRGKGKANGERPATLIANTLQQIGGKVKQAALREALDAQGRKDAMIAVGAAIRYGYIKRTGKGVNTKYEFAKMPESAATE